MATINRASFAVIWSTPYPSLLSTGTGRLVTRRGYAEVYDQLGGDLRVPWTDDQGAQHWSQFWAHYVGKPERTRQMSSDGAWDRVLPFLWVHQSTVTGPEGTDPQIQVLVYPSAIVVIIRVDVAGEWALAHFAADLAGIRDGKVWSLTTPQGTSQNRNLDGIAADLRDRAVPVLSSGAPPPAGVQEVITVTAPILGEGDSGAFALTDPTASACLVGLAVLGPPGALREDHLLEENSDPRYAARVYALKSGHAIWNTRDLLDPQKGDPIGCLHRNHTELVGHISALAGIVSWAAEQLQGAGVPVAVQPLVKRAAERLDQLYRGNTVKTYRSGIAKARIEPLRESVDSVRAAL
jgi:hypothetical protein